jgi:hypothetical protein
MSRSPPTLLVIKVPHPNQSLMARVPNNSMPSLCQEKRKQRMISNSSSPASNVLEAMKRHHPRSASYARMYSSTEYAIVYYLTNNREKYGTDRSTLPDDVANFIYGPKTGNTNLRRHLYLVHPDEYDKAVKDHKWTFRLSTETREPSTQDPRNVRNREVPPFSPAAFLEHLVRFIVADDQVSLDYLSFFQAHNFSVDPCCRMSRVSTLVYGSLRDTRRQRHPSPR